MSQIKKEIYGYKKNNNIEDAKEILINNIFFDSEYFNNKSKKTKLFGRIFTGIFTRIIGRKGN